MCKSSIRKEDKMKTIKVDQKSWKKLSKIKMNKGLRSLNEVISYILNKFKRSVK